MLKIFYHNRVDKIRKKWSAAVLWIKVLKPARQKLGFEVGLKTLTFAGSGPRVD